MAFSFPSLREIISQIKRAFLRFPAAFLSALVATGLMLFLIEVEGPEFYYFDTFMKVILVLSLGVFAFTALRLLGDKNPLCLLGIVGLVGYYFSLPDMMKELSDTTFTRHFFLILMFFIMIWWAPFWNRRVGNGQFWEWTQQVVFGFLMSIVFGIILYAGLAGALYAIDTLFSLGIEGKRYGQLAILVIGLFSVFYFLSQIPQKQEDLQIHAYTKVENIFAKYLLAPMALGYFVILYAYSFKILFSQSWPQGILAWIIIAFAAVAILTYLFWTPLWSKRGEKYKRFFIFALWLQTLMLGMAIWMRIQAYGWTESRYMVVVLGAWLFVVSLYFLFFKKARYQWAFMLLSALIMISQIGPFSAYAIAKKSQQTRLKKMLATHKPLSSKSPLNVRYEISDSISYLSRSYGLESLEGIIPDIVAKYKKAHFHDTFDMRYGFPLFATEALGFNYVNRWELEEQRKGNIRPMGLYRPHNMIQNIEGYAWMCDVTYDYYGDRELSPQLEDTRFELDDKRLLIQEKNVTIATIPLEEFYAKVQADEALQKELLIEEPSEINWSQKLDVNYNDANVKVKISFFEIFGDGNGTMRTISAKVLYKRK